MNHPSSNEAFNRMGSTLSFHDLWIKVPIHKNSNHSFQKNHNHRNVATNTTPLNGLPIPDQTVVPELAQQNLSTNAQIKSKSIWRIPTIATSLLQKFRLKKNRSNVSPQELSSSTHPASHHHFFPFKKRSPLPLKTVIHGIHGTFHAGRLTAVLGPSGSGKTTLLNSLAGIYLKNGITEGSIQLDGIPMDPFELRQICGYVYQDDIILETMTIHEALVMATVLRNPPMSKDDTERNVREAIKVLGLEGAEYTLIGNATKKGISGGERKRTAIGMELVAHPNVLLLDECTTGLDSFTAYSVMSVLKRLAKIQGKTIVTTLHQPSSELFEILDDVMILVSGKILYFGPANEMVQYFSRLGYPCPKYTNPPDYVFMGIINNNPYPNGLNTLLDHFTKLDRFSVAIESGDHMIDRQQVIQSYKKYRPTRTQQMKYLLPRAWNNAIRNRLMLQARLIQMIVLGVMIGLIYLAILRPAKSDPVATAQSITGALFFVAVNMLFSATMPVLTIFVTERPVFLREYLGGYYGASTYYWSKTIVELPFNLIFPFIFAAISYWMIGFFYSVIDWLFYSLFAVLVALTGASFGICAASVFEDIGIALTAVPLIILPLMLYGGLLVNTKTSFAWLSWIQWVSPVQYSFTGLMKSFWTGQSVGSENGNDQLEKYGLNGKLSIGLNVIILLVIWVVLMIIGNIGLHRIACKASGESFWARRKT